MPCHSVCVKCGSIVIPFEIFLRNELGEEISANMTNSFVVIRCEIILIVFCFFSYDTHTSKQLLHTNKFSSHTYTNAYRKKLKQA